MTDSPVSSEVYRAFLADLQGDEAGDLLSEALRDLYERGELDNEARLLSVLETVAESA